MPFNDMLLYLRVTMAMLFYPRNAAVDGERNLYTGIQMRHAALERNKRCLLAYL